MAEKKEKLHLSDFLFYILIVAFCMNLFGRGSIFCLLFGLIALFFLPKKIEIDYLCIITSILSIVVFIFGSYHFGIEEGLKGLNFGLMYFVGNQMLKKSQDKEMFIKRIIFSIFLGVSLLIILLYIKNLTISSFGEIRILVDIWGNRKLSVTLVGMLSSFVIGYSFYGIFFCKNIFIKIYTIIAFLVVLLINMMTATRTPFVLFFITSILFLLVYIAKFNNIKKIVKIIVIVLLFCLIINFFFKEQVNMIANWILTTPILKRFNKEGITTSRVEVFKEHFNLMGEYFWGGSKISSIVGNNAHNIIQETYDLYGVFSMVLMIILLFDIFIKLIKLIFLSNKTNLIYLLICMHFVFIIQIFLEPTISGFPCYVFSFLLIYGSTNSYINCLKIQE